MSLVLMPLPLRAQDPGEAEIYVGSGAKAGEMTDRTAIVLVEARNPEQGAFSEESSRMDWSDSDRAPEDALNRILWRMAKGPDAPYPSPIHRALFTMAPAEGP
jgi:hypothetical protein